MPWEESITRALSSEVVQPRNGGQKFSALRVLPGSEELLDDNKQIPQRPIPNPIPIRPEPEPAPDSASDPESESGWSEGP